MCVKFGRYAHCVYLCIANKDKYNIKMQTSTQNSTNGNFKADKVFTTTDFQGKKHTFYEKTIGSAKYQCLSLEALEERIKNHKEEDYSGAADWYGKGMFNGD